VAWADALMFAAAANSAIISEQRTADLAGDGF